MGTIGCTETLGTNNQQCLTSQKRAVVINVARKPDILRGVKFLWCSKVYKHYTAESQCCFTLRCLYSFTQMTWRGSRLCICLHETSPEPSVYFSLKSVKK